MRVIIALAAFLALVSCTSVPTYSSADTIIADVAIFDAASGERVPNHDVVIAGKKIIAVGPAGSADFTAARRIDAQGLTLLPGLINSHIHLQLSDDPQAGMESLLRRGVTSVRDLAGDARTPARLEARRRAGEITTPEIIYAALLAGPQHMADPRTTGASDDYPPGGAPWMRSVTEASDVQTIISDAAATGASGVKLYASLKPPLLEKVSREAQAQGLRVWTHSVIFPGNAVDVVASRPDQIIHAKGLASADDKGLPDNFRDGVMDYMTGLPLDHRDPESDFYRSLFAKMIEGDILLEPALIADGDVGLAAGRKLPQPLLDLREWSCRATGAAWRSGVTIGVGTDYDGEGDLLWREMDRLVECGMSRGAVLTAVTWNNARALGIADRAGLVSPGYEADLLLVEGDPTKDLSALGKVRFVFSNGELVVGDRD